MYKKEIRYTSYYIPCLSHVFHLLLMSVPYVRRDRGRSGTGGTDMRGERRVGTVRGRSLSSFTLVRHSPFSSSPRSLRSLCSSVGSSHLRLTVPSARRSRVSSTRLTRCAEAMGVSRSVRCETGRDTGKDGDMEAGWEGSFIAFATRALHAPPTSHKKSEETE